jgi:Domain of unknown function (DUF1772)
MSVAATFFLGLFSGSLMLEGFVLVPFWRTLTPNEFFALHHQFGPRLFRYFAPLTTVAVALPLAAAVSRRNDPHSLYRWIAAALGLAVLAAFPLFFKRANDAFANRTVTDGELPSALHRWAQVHGARTMTAIAAFLFSALATR